MRALLYRPEWQMLRVSFLQEYRSDGGWTTMEGTTRNLNKIVGYVSPEQDSHEEHIAAFQGTAMGWDYRVEQACRLYRTINCLNAVRMGNSGQGLARSEQDTLVLMARDQLQSMQTVMYHRDLTFAASRWDWRVVRKELNILFRVSPKGFAPIEKNLTARRDNHLRKGGSTKSRPELVMFLELMRRVRTGE